MTSALVLSGGVAPYVDPWHPFAATSERIAGLLRGLGMTVAVRTDVAAAAADLDGVDLLVANAPTPDGWGADAAAEESLRAFAERGGSILALHVGVTGLLGSPTFASLIGAHWVQGQTMHPPLGPATVTAEGRSFTIHDELYTRLAFDAEPDVLVDHEFEGERHPLVWATEAGPTRVIADALGHGTESFDSPDHTDVLERSARWLARETETAHS